MGKKGVSPKHKWNSRYDAADYEPDTSPVPFLTDVIGAIEPGRALCLAAGCGRNAVYLAQRGFEVTAVDISARGLAWCRQLASERGVRVQTVEADLLDYDLGSGDFDLITDFNYYEPALFPAIRKAVKPGGRFLLQTFSIHQAGRGHGPQDPRHQARPEVVLEAFRDWRIRLFGDLDLTRTADGQETTDAVVRLLAQKPA